jgi:hypothetical protein
LIYVLIANHHRYSSGIIANPHPRYLWRSLWHGKEVSPGPLDGVAGTKVRGKVAEIHRSKENVVGPDGEWWMMDDGVMMDEE